MFISTIKYIFERNALIEKFWQDRSDYWRTLYVKANVRMLQTQHNNTELASLVNELAESLFFATTYIRYVMDNNPELHKLADGSPQASLCIARSLELANKKLDEIFERNATMND